MSGCGHLVKMQYFSPFLVYTWAWIRQIKYIVMTTNGRVYQNDKFHNHGARVLMLRRDHMHAYIDLTVTYSWETAEYTVCSVCCIICHWIPILGVVRLLCRPSVDRFLVCFVCGVIRQGASLVFPDWKTFHLKNITSLAMQHK